MILYPPEETIQYPHDRLEFTVVVMAATLIASIILSYLWKNDPRK